MIVRVGSSAACDSAAVEDLRVRALLRRPHRDVVASHDLADLRRRVVEVAGDDRVRRAHGHTCRFQPDLDAVVAEVALVGRVRLGVDVDRVVGAGVHARLAPDAPAVVEVDHAVRRAVQRPGRADRDARRVVALVAAHHREGAPGVRELTGLDVLHPRPVHSERHVVLALACDSARVAPDATVTCEHEAEACHVVGSRRRP